MLNQLILTCVYPSKLAMCALLAASIFVKVKFG
jgi:hypothetical protein